MDPNNSPFREKGDVAPIQTPNGVKQAWQQAIREQKLLNRILKIQISFSSVCDKRSKFHEV